MRWLFISTLVCAFIRRQSVKSAPNAGGIGGSFIVAHQQMFAELFSLFAGSGGSARRCQRGATARRGISAPRKPRERIQKLPGNEADDFAVAAAVARNGC